MCLSFFPFLAFGMTLLLLDIYKDHVLADAVDLAPRNDDFLTAKGKEAFVIDKHTKRKHAAIAAVKANI